MISVDGRGVVNGPDIRGSESSLACTFIIRSSKYIYVTLNVADILGRVAENCLIKNPFSSTIACKTRMTYFKAISYLFSYYGYAFLLTAMVLNSIISLEGDTVDYISSIVSPYTSS